MSEDIKKLNELTKTIQTKINELKRCFVCGRDDLLTQHHVIPQRINRPFFNFKVPICSNCVRIVHTNDDFVAILRRMFLR